MSGLVLTFPIVAGKVEAWRRFCQEIAGTRRLPYEASRLELGITYERLALVETAFGSASVITIEADDVGLALSLIITSSRPFDHWYRDQMQVLHGVSLDTYTDFLQPAQAPITQELLFEWAVSPDLNG